MKAQRGSSGITLLFFNLGARWGWVAKTKTQPLYPRKRTGIPCIGDWVARRAGLEG